MTNNTRICPECNNQFTFGRGRGQARKNCSKECTQSASRSREIAASSGWPTCCEESCGKTVRSARATHCEAHYARKRRSGSVRLKAEVAPPPLHISHSGGYVLEYSPNHPLQMAYGRRVYQHRVVYHAAHGDGPFECNWCGCAVTWSDMHVDHLNDVKNDNREGNLVASCPQCNTKRGRGKMTDSHRKRSKAKVTWRGETLTLGQWASRIGISRESVAWRLSNGWDVDRALTEARGRFGPQSLRG